MIRSAKHSINQANFHKKEIVKQFLAEYRIALQEFVDYYWENPAYNKGVLQLDIKNDILLSVPYIDYNLIKSKTSLSGRALSSAMFQACGIVLGVIKTRSKYQYILKKLTQEDDQKNIKKIIKKLEKCKFTKPTIRNVSAEISSKLIDIQFDKNSFDCFLRLKCLGKDYPHVKIPINLTKTDRKWRKGGKFLGSILLSEKFIDFRYEKEAPALKKRGKIVGADTGVNTLISLSNRQASPLTNNHGYSFNDILEILSRKKKGSKAFRRAQEHRKNFINWSINKLNFKGIKQVNLEHIDNLFYKKNTSSKLKRFTNALIEEKITRLLEENGVRLVLKAAIYKSQRCSKCGMVHYLNRKGKIFSCRNCENIDDADFNSASNNEIYLPEVPKWIVFSKLNKSIGFLWKSDGFYDLEGQELNESLITRKKDKVI